MVATNDPICATAEEQPLADILTAIRRKSTVAGIGVHAQVNGEQYLLSESQFLARYGAHPEAIEAAIEMSLFTGFAEVSLPHLCGPGGSKCHRSTSGAGHAWDAFTLRGHAAFSSAIGRARVGCYRRARFRELFSHGT